MKIINMKIIFSIIIIFFTLNCKGQITKKYRTFVNPHHYTLPIETTFKIITNSHKVRTFIWDKKPICPSRVTTWHFWLTSIPYVEDSAKVTFSDFGK